MVQIVIINLMYIGHIIDEATIDREAYRSMNRLIDGMSMLNERVE